MRGRTNALVMASWAIGGIVAGLVGIFSVSTLVGAAGWRYALLFGGVSALYALHVRGLIPESPRWLASQGRLQEANRVIEQVSGIPAERALYDPTELHRSVFAQLREPWRDYRGRLVYGMALDFSEAAGYYWLFTFVSVFVLTEGVVDVSTTTVPYFYVVANMHNLRDLSPDDPAVRARELAEDKPKSRGRRCERRVRPSHPSGAVLGTWREPEGLEIFPSNKTPGP